MDEKQALGRPSGIPRISRLPVPRTFASPSPSPSPAPAPAQKPAQKPALRPSPSREALSSGLRNPRLRPAASRDQLVSSPVPKKTESRTALRPRREVPPPSSTRKTESRAYTNAPKTAHCAVRAAAVDPTTTNKSPTPSEDNKDVLIPRTTSLTRLPWEPSSAIVPCPGSAPDVLSTAGHVSPDGDDADCDLPSLDTLRFKKSVKPRPSLSDRTIETLSQLPSSPALSKKSSTFFDSDGGCRPRSRSGSGTSRPGSSYTSDGSLRPTSRHSRTGSSSGPDENPFSSVRAAPVKSYRPLPAIEGTPARRVSGVRSLKAPSTRTSTPASPPGSSSTCVPTPGKPALQSPSPTRPSGIMPPKTGAKTVPARQLKPRASVNGLYKKPSLSALDETEPPSVAPPQKLKSARSYGALRKPTPTKISIPASPAVPSDAAEAARKSSAALREQIAKARAAKRAADRQSEEANSALIPVPDASHVGLKSPIIPADNGFEFGIAVTHDPFNTQRTKNAKNKIVQQRLATARTSGRLNIAAMGLKEIPADVLKMYDMESLSTNDGSWAESVDLTRFVAADNELEIIDDAIFPDVTPEQMAEDEDAQGNIFGGLEAMDLHGNLLISLPIGIRQLRLLTSLNLSQNRLGNNCLDVIAEVTTLRDLKLANNLLYGPLAPSFAKLEKLEIFDLHGNTVSSLPPGIENLSRLRILNLSDNSFESLPFRHLSKLPLVELLVKSNKLTGTLIEDGVETLPNLQMLDLSCNQLTRLVSSGSTISLPLVHQLVLSMNRLQELPDVSSWVSLLNLTATENSISEFPSGFTSLEKLRHADFSANDIRIVPPEISRMDSLTMIRLSGNPLRDKKFVSATTEELKDVLAGRLEPPPPYEDNDSASDATVIDAKEVDGIATSFGQLSIKDAVPTIVEGGNRDNNSDDTEDFATPPTSSPNSPARSRSRSHTLAKETWPVKQGGVLDRSNTKSSSLHPVVCSRVAADNKVREVQLHHNLFSCFPNSLFFFADTLAALSLAHNQLVGESYLTEELELPALRELNLVSNHITSLKPLTSYLNAPQLEKMDVSMNRITALPPDLRVVFPRLIVLLAANNHLIDLDPDTIKGLEIVDAANNDISHLNPRIGLLGGSDGLKRLEVSGNRFRVPRWNVLERGTAATLRWLRGRVPVAEMASWKKEQGGDSGNTTDTSLADID